MTSGRDLIRAQRLDLVRRAEERYGLPPSHKGYEIDLGGAVFSGGGELDLSPVYFDMPGSAGLESDRRANKVKRFGTGNSAAFALIESFSRAYREPTLYVWRGPFLDLGASERIVDHQLTGAYGLLRKPNAGANFTMSHLRAAIAKAKIVAGNFYLVKARTGGGDVLTNTTGAVSRLWPVWPTQMQPATYAKGDPRQSNGWIDYYAYEVGRGRPLELPVENVIHFRNGINPVNPRVGIGVVEEFALEVATDAEAALLVKAVMSNLGIPGLVFAPEGGTNTGIGKDDRESIKASLMAKTTGNRRGEPIVLSRPTSLQQFQVNLDVLKLESVWMHVESRISAVIGWPAILAGLQAGLENATYSNANSLKRFATENAAIPTWEEDSEVWTDELGPEFGLRDDEYIAYDYPSVRALQEDENERWRRVGEAFGRNEITLGQHHTMLGLELPAGVDPMMRAADFASTGAKLGGLFGKGLKTFPGRFTTSDKPLTAKELDGGELTEEEVHQSLLRMADRLAEVEPELAGMLDAETEEPEGEGEKRLPFRKADPRKRTWTWDPDSQRYRWPNTRRLVPEGRVFRARERLIEDSQKRMAGLAERYTNGEMSLSQFQKQMRREYTDQHCAMRALGRGGERQLTRADRQAISDMVKKENQYLAGFARDIADGKLSTAEIQARAQLYAGANMRQEYAAARLTAHTEEGYTHKRRVGPGDERACSTCLEEIAMGWVDIDHSGFVIGATKCQSNDRCEIEFSRQLPGGGRMY